MLSYTSETVYAFLEGYNEALWPAQAVALLLGIFVLFAALAPIPQGGRVISAMLAGFWLWSGLVYYGQYFAEIDFSAPVFAGFFVLQAALLVWTGVIRAGLEFHIERGPRSIAGLVLAAFGLVGYTLITCLSGQSAQEVQMFAIAPAPTVIFTLGVLLLAKPRAPWALTVIPLVWTAVAGTIAWFLEMPEDFCAVVAGLTYIAVVISTSSARNAQLIRNT